MWGSLLRDGVGKFGGHSSIVYVRCGVKCKNSLGGAHNMV